MLLALLKKTIFGLILLYLFNLVSLTINVLIPINYITVGVVSIFGPLGLVFLNILLIIL